MPDSFDKHGDAVLVKHWQVLLPECTRAAGSQRTAAHGEAVCHGDNAEAKPNGSTAFLSPTCAKV